MNNKNIDSYPFANPEGTVPSGFVVFHGRIKEINSQKGILEKNGESLAFQCLNKTPPPPYFPLIDIVPSLNANDLVSLLGKFQKGIFWVIGIHRLAPSLQNPSPILRHIQKIKEILQQRNLLNSIIRKFFTEKNFLEVETPTLTQEPDPSPHIQPLKTEIQLNESLSSVNEFYLISSPEFSMKSLLCCDFKEIFTICKVFRNQETGKIHQPEFTLLEWYRAYENGNRIQKDTEDLIEMVAHSFFGKFKSTWQGIDFSWKSPFEKIRLEDAFMDLAKMNLLPEESSKEFQKRAKDQGIKFSSNHLSWGEIFTQIFIEKIEPKLPPNRPFFLIDYPKKEAALAKIKKNSVWADRFELYLGQIELGNGFSELNDPQEQKCRFEEDLQIRTVLNKEAVPIPENFLTHLAYGMPPSAGIALGLDRLLMVLCNKSNLKEVLPFPI